ncbi:hypothetical protein D3C87_1942890 [compost metagenome]
MMSGCLSTFWSKKLQLCDPLHSFRQPGFIADQPYPHIAFTVFPKADPRRYYHMRLIQQQIGKAL